MHPAIVALRAEVAEFAERVRVMDAQFEAGSPDWLAVLTIYHGLSETLTDLDNHDLVMKVRADMEQNQ